jgi:two-component system NarL family sensor kinase
MGETEITLFIILVNLVILILISAIISFIVMYRKKKMVYQKEKQLLAIEAMLKGQEEERSRVAKDLHDGLGGLLSGVKLSFINLKENIQLDEHTNGLFEKSVTQLDNTIQELRKVAHNLMPETLIKFGLKNAVEDFCESMQQSSGCSIIYQQMGEEREIGNIADVNIYRIIQELVNNSLKHGKPKQIIVQLTKTATKILVSVEDDGKGFDTAELETRNGIGIANIKHRVSYFNGVIQIQSRPGEGTAFNIELIT